MSNTNLLFKKLTGLALLLLAFATLDAQVELGLTGGYVKAWEEYQREDLPQDAPIHVEGFRVGLTAYADLNRFISIGTEPAYVQRGAACEPGFVIFNQDTKLSLNYAELPLHLRLRHQLFTPKLEVFASAGYSLSYLLDAEREVIDLSTKEVIFNEKLDLERANMHRIDHGLRAGGGLRYNFNRFALLAKYERYYALTDVDKSTTSRNREMGVTLGVTYLVR